MLLYLFSLADKPLEDHPNPDLLPITHKDSQKIEEVEIHKKLLKSLEQLNSPSIIPPWFINVLKVGAKMKERDDETAGPLESFIFLNKLLTETLMRKTTYKTATGSEADAFCNITKSSVTFLDELVALHNTLSNHPKVKEFYTFGTTSRPTTFELLDYSPEIRLYKKE
ncbi:MAG: hypothetical protein H6850_02060 [Alphaproteobacteria bacterium]|nr:MAG: hypothetical protein H6850_02060 [Alphaproteobacteria bacterium]